MYRLFPVYTLVSEIGAGCVMVVGVPGFNLRGGGLMQYGVDRVYVDAWPYGPLSPV